MDINLRPMCMNAFTKFLPVANQVGPKRAKEMWFLSKFYTAAEAERMGLVNTVVPVSLIFSNFSKFGSIQCYLSHNFTNNANL